MGRAALGLAVAAGAFAAIYFGFMEHRADQSSILPSLLIQDHIELQLRKNPFDLQTSNKDELERWFVTRVDFAVHIPSLRDARLRGGRLCYLLDRRIAFAIFEKDGEALSAYVLDGRGVDLSSMGHEDSLSKQYFYRHSEKGYNVVLWRVNDLVYALVSALSIGKLESLATEI